MWISFLTVFFSFQSAASLNNFLRTGLPFPLHQKAAEMKVPPISLPNGMDRIPLPLPFSPGMIPSFSMLITFHNHRVQVIFTLCNVQNLYLPLLLRYAVALPQPFPGPAAPIAPRDPSEEWPTR